LSDVYRPPASDVVRLEVPGSGGSVERSLAGDFQFEPLEVVQEAWRLTDGVKLIVLVGSAVLVVAILAVQSVVTRLLPPPTDLAGLMWSGFGGLALQMVIIGPISAGLFIVVARHAVGLPVAIGDLFGQYDKFGRIVGVMLLSTLLTYVGMLLLILPGIYLSIAYVMAVPLVAEKNMSVWQALETSRKVITKCWWRMLFIWLLIVLIMIVSALPAFIPWIWTVPMFGMVFGVIYRNLFGVQTATH
jgi:hypothetical protein